MKPNHGNTGNSPMDHWAFGAFDWHIQNKLCAIKAKSLTYFVFPKMDSLKMSSPSVVIRTNCCEFRELISSPKKVTNAL